MSSGHRMIRWEPSASTSAYGYSTSTHTEAERGTTSSAALRTRGFLPQLSHMASGYGSSEPEDMRLAADTGPRS